MSGGALPNVGVKAVVQNFTSFMASMKAINAAVRATGGVSGGAAGLVKTFGLSLSAASVSAGVMSGAIAALQVSLMAIVGAIALAVAGIGAFIALGVRGSPLVGIAENFDRMAQRAGIAADTLLIDMRRAAAGTISDFELMTRANAALTGTSEAFANQFGVALPRILEIARAQARATGKSIDYLYESLVNGIKRAEPRLIDNAYIILKIKQVNEDYAAAMGITVDQMTLYDRQVALLNATLAAGEESVANMAATQETAAEKIQRAQAQITNILDTLGLAVQPAFGAILDIVNSALSAIGNFVRNSAPYIAAISQLVAKILTPIRDGIGSFAQSLADPSTAKAFWTGGARMIGALAGGIADAANAYVFPTVISIATFIADFLSGMSPPPKGPLSTIDIGGRNVMLAWLGGFTGVGLEPVAQVAAEVNAMLGDIGKQSLEVVESRLAMLDNALKPFEERLLIIKNIFDSIREPAERAIDAINRQLQSYLPALVKGSTDAAAAIRGLDANRDTIEKMLSANQDVTDQFEIQMMLLRAQQEPERTLLQIQQARLKLLEQAAGVTKKETEKKGPKELKGKEPKGKEEEPPREPPEVGGAPVDAGSSLELLNLDQGSIDEALAELRSSFLEGVGSSFDTFGANTKTLQEQIGRIQAVADSEGGIGGGIINGLKKLGSKALEEAIKVGTSITDGIRDGISGLINIVAGKFTELGDTFITIASPIVGGVIDWTTQAQTDIETFVANFSTSFLEGLGTLKLKVIGWVESIPTFFTTMWETVSGLASSLFDPTVENSFAWWWATLPSRIGGFITSLITSVEKNLVDPLKQKVTDLVTSVRDMLTGEQEFSISSIINGLLDILLTVPRGITDSLGEVGPAFWTAIVNPAVGTLNSALRAIGDFLTSAAHSVADFITNANDILQFLPGWNSGAMLAAAAAIKNSRVDIGTISVPYPSGWGEPPSPPGTRGARGGIFGEGSMWVGENGPEIVTSASKLAVFPNPVIKGIKALSSLTDGRSTMSNASSVSTYNYDYSRRYGDFNINGVTSPQSWRREWAMMRAFNR